MATNAPRSEARPTFHFVGGKGGVGKTTCSAAFALAAAGSGRRVLVATTDPAPSLGDAFGVRLTSRPTHITSSRRPLFAVELDASTALRRWLSEREPLLETIAVDGTWLDREDVQHLLRLSLPGIDELAALFEIGRLARSSRFDHIVVDTAPTGHTLRLLALPQALANVASLFDAMRERPRQVEAALRGAWREGPQDALIHELSGTASALFQLLRDPGRTRVTWITLPEELPVRETNTAIEALEATGIGVGDLVVNRSTPARREPCAHCDARRSTERRALREIRGDRPAVQVIARDVEPRGLTALRGIGAELVSPPAAATTRRGAGRWQAALDGERPALTDIVPPATRLLLVGGKGGVGKTTASTGLALAIARHAPDRHVLLLSTDPAHSLADLLGADMSGPKTGCPPNLSIHELDPAAAVTSLRVRYAAAIDELFSRFTGESHLAATTDRAILQRLLDVAPPGLDELAAVVDITDALVSSASPWDLLVMDTAPTGHAIRLLETPALVHDWVKAIMTILLKYQGVTGLGSLGSMLVDMSQRLGRLRELLTDAERARFLVVTRAAALPRLETDRLLRQLTRLRIAAPAVLVNALGRGTCQACARASRAERREVTALARRLSSGRRRPVLLGAPVWIPPPAGARALGRWQATWVNLGTRIRDKRVGYHRNR